MQERKLTTLLEAREVTKKFLGFTAVDRVSLRINKGEIVGLIGPNGSGKTTLFNCITGYYKPDGGSIFLKDGDITGFAPDRIARTGLTRSFQLSQCFGELTLLENLLTAALYRRKEKLFGSVFRLPSVLREDEEHAERALELLKFVELFPLKDKRAEDISFGQKKLLEFAMTLMPNPEIVLLDEPVSGINPVLIDRLLHYITLSNKEHGVTFFLVEHNVKVVMKLCEKVFVLSAGRKIAEGTPEEIQKNEEVIEMYFRGGR